MNHGIDVFRGLLYRFLFGDVSPEDLHLSKQFLQRLSVAHRFQVEQAYPIPALHKCPADGNPKAAGTTRNQYPSVIRAHISTRLLAPPPAQPERYRGYYYG